MFKWKKKNNETPKIKRKINKVNLSAMIVGIICIFELIALLGGSALILYLLKDKPDFDMNRFQNQESSEIYDAKGNVVAELGMTIRENIGFNDMPNSLVDAFVAVEDSRFFSHNGFDIARFTAAMFKNLRSLSFSQGGSTFSMQLVKNTYFVDDEAGINAPKKISRKVQEIALAFELERNTNKRSIFELYVNKLNFGGNRNIRGVEKAAEYYFGKSVRDLNLAESALLAGVINAPYAYNPFNFLEAATKRRDTVLYQMYNHGYITKEEYQLAKAIKVEDLLVDESARRKENEGTNYQAYIDAVVSEVSQLTNLDPYTTPMKIYTYMDVEVQRIADLIEAGKIEEIAFPDDEMEIASVSVNNQTGAINAIIGGRNYADGGQLLLNHAIDQYKQPGSAIKPILDYAPAFEHLGWATSHVLVDKPIVYAGTDVVINNADGRYRGQVTLRDAVGNSLNTPALQALQEVINVTSSKEVVNYMHKLGFQQVKEKDFNIQYGIGGSTLEVSTLQMAGAQAALLNGGQYIKPHTIERIEFLDGKNPIKPNYTPVEAISAQASYLMSNILYSNVYGGYANLMQILRDSYPVYAKTGTSDWGSAGVDYGIPVGSIKDAWMIASTSQYTVATWLGYERAQKDKQSYITLDAYLSNIQGHITNLLTDKNVEVHGTPAAVTRPSGITEITHILGTWPYAAPIADMDDTYLAVGLVKTSSAKLVSPETSSVEKISENGSNAVLNPYNNTLDLSWAKYPDESKLKVADDTMDISLHLGSTTVAATGKRLFDYSWIMGPIRYMATIKVKDQIVKEIISEKETYSEKLDLHPGDKVEACLFYGFEKKKNIQSENKVCKSFTMQDQQVDFQLPESGLSQNELMNYPLFHNYGMKIHLNEITTTNAAEAGSYNFVMNGQTYQANEKISKIKLSQLYGQDITINYKIQGMSITSNVSLAAPITVNQTIVFTVSGASDDVSWRVDPSDGMSMDNGRLTLGENIPDGSVVTVTARDNQTGQEKQVTFTVSNP